MSSICVLPLSKILTFTFNMQKEYLRKKTKDKVLVNYDVAGSFQKVPAYKGTALVEKAACILIKVLKLQTKSAEQQCLSRAARNGPGGEIDVAHITRSREASAGLCNPAGQVRRTWGLMTPDSVWDTTGEGNQHAAARSGCSVTATVEQH